MEGQFATHALILEQQRRIKALEAELASTQIELMRLRASVHAANEQHPNTMPSDGVTPPVSSSALPSNDRRSTEDSKKSSSRYWTADEHARFLEGLELFGQKDIKSISRHVGTRSATQVRTHAQKYYLRIARERSKADGVSSRTQPTRDRRSNQRGRPRACHSAVGAASTSGSGALVPSTGSYSAESGSANGFGTGRSQSSTDRGDCGESRNGNQDQNNVEQHIDNVCHSQMESAKTVKIKKKDSNSSPDIGDNSPILNDINRMYQQEKEVSMNNATGVYGGRKRGIINEAESRSHEPARKRSVRDLSKRENVIVNSQHDGDDGEEEVCNIPKRTHYVRDENRNEQIGKGKENGRAFDDRLDIVNDHINEQLGEKSESESENNEEGNESAKEKHMQAAKQNISENAKDRPEDKDKTVVNKIEREIQVEQTKENGIENTIENANEGEDETSIDKNKDNEFDNTNQSRNDETKLVEERKVIEKSLVVRKSEERKVDWSHKQLVNESETMEDNSQHIKRAKAEKELSEENGLVTVGSQLPPRFGERGTMGLVESGGSTSNLRTLLPSCGLDGMMNGRAVSLRRNGSSSSILADLSRSNSFLIPQNGRGVTRSNSILSLLSGMPVMRESPSTDRLLGIDTTSEDKMILTSNLKHENGNSNLDGNNTCISNQQQQAAGSGSGNGNGVTGVSSVGTLGDRAMSFGQLNHMGVDDLEDAGTVALSIDHNYYHSI